MPFKTPAKASRSQRRESLRRLLVRTMAELDITQEEAAASIGTSRTVYQRICARNDDASLRLSDVAALDEELALTLLRWAVDQIQDVHGRSHYTITLLPPPREDDGSDVKRLAWMVKEHGEAAAKYAELVATERWSSKDIEDLDRELQEAISAAVAVRQAARARLRDFIGEE